MDKNVGKVDKLVRIIGALTLVGLYFSGLISGVLSYIGLIAAGIMILTGLVNFCPLYRVLGINTCKRQ
ncbi:MAG: DUF2892 domain-containing protein [Spirosomataceae bacterium]